MVKRVSEGGRIERGKKKESRVRSYLGSRPILSLRDALDAAEPRPEDDFREELDKEQRETLRAEKKNYAQYLSEAIAVLIANRLRDAFPEILPLSNGQGQESRARTGKGIKKLDVNYSTPQLGLGLGVSIKTLNFRDPSTRRYTKNPTRLDNELRAEAMDYHQRQPYAVLVAIVYVPEDAADDGRPGTKQSWSSFAQIVNVLRHRANRQAPTDDIQLFERLYIGLYRHQGPDRGIVRYFDTSKRVPQFGLPQDSQLLDIEGLLREIVAVYDSRNTVAPAWGTDDKMIVPLDALIEQELVPPEDDEPLSDE